MSDKVVMLDTEELSDSTVADEQKDVKEWANMMNKGTVHAVEGLSQTVGRNITVTSFNLRTVAADDICDMVGGPETSMVGVYLSIQSGAPGHILLLYPPEIARGLIDMLMGQKSSNTHELEEIEQSALAEVGNIVGSYFLNSIADDTGIRFVPSTPQVMMDMAGMIVSMALEDILGRQYTDDIFVMETEFRSDDKKLNGVLMILPSTDFLSIVKKHTE
ncbi:MAG: chemotaxis protein CheC [Chloroflexota bacterium]|nr:chemotaxis protein CheC [Chloroflexota bacterium]